MRAERRSGAGGEANGLALDYRLPKHEKIRFRRHEISELGSFPSAEGRHHLMGRRKGGRVARYLALGVAFAASLVLMLALGLYLFITIGVGSDRLGDQAEDAIKSLSGLDVEATIGAPRISVDRAQLLAVSVPSVTLQSKDGATTFLTAGSIDFGIRPAPLLAGNVQLGSARISDARIFAGAFGTGGSSDWTEALKNADGLVDPDLVAPALFGSVHALFDALGATRSLELDDVEIALPPGPGPDVLNIDDATLTRASDAELDFSAHLSLDGREVSVVGNAVRQAGSQRIAALSLSLDVAEGADIDPAAPVADMLGPLDVSLNGEEGEAGQPSRLSLSASLGRSIFTVDNANYLDGEADLLASIVTGENKVRIEKLSIREGRSSYVLFGPVGPRPAAAGQPPAYRFELASDKSTSAPSGSAEPALDFSLMLAGSYEPTTGRLAVPGLTVRTSSGELRAAAAVDFVAGQAPGVDLSVTVPELSMGHFKQLWPFTAADSARNWVMNNLFGGRVTNGWVKYHVPPGRIGNGIPLFHDEVSGHIEMSGARFDITGTIPPMRDAVGTVDFRGNDIDVNLASGAVYLANGQKVTATDGVFTIRDAYKDQLLGQLDIDIAGEASAIAELASFEPIDGLATTGMAPGDFSGQMSGHVSTQIPLIGDIDTRALEWMVSLDFKDMALARPIEDQLVTDAAGNISLDPDKAVVKAKARLNGAPAEINMVEPLRDGGAQPSRDIALVLDDEAREELVPGIDMLVQGPMKVAFSAGKGSAQRFKADLTGARLDIPWIGWSKGPGIKANVEFSLVRSAGTTQLDGFKLSGDSFEIGGTITLVNGALTSAKLGTVQLNRGDDAAVTLQRSGKGYDIKISGKSLDVRSMIRLLKSEKTGSDSVAGGGRRISVNASLGRLAGFGGESLTGVKLSYDGGGSAANAARFTGATASGAAVSMQNRIADGVRSLQMESADAGAVLRFLDIYQHMSGGVLKFALSGPVDGTLAGQMDASNFELVDEPKLRSLVSSSPAGDGRSLNQAVKRDIDTSRVTFERAYAAIYQNKGTVELKNGVLRGPLIGSTFQGTLYDDAGNMDMTGTFMPAYGLNRIFGELPLVGVILGNGRDRGLIGVTFRLVGDADKPTLQINPLSVIAPGIFRSIFEFR